MQAGDNPRVVGDKLRSFVAPAEREVENDDATAAKATAPAATSQPAAEAA